MANAILPGCNPTCGSREIVASFVGASASCDTVKPSLPTVGFSCSTVESVPSATPPEGAAMLETNAISSAPHVTIFITFSFGAGRLNRTASGMILGACNRQRQSTTSPLGNGTLFGKGLHIRQL
uniref:Uncharacterized protein n=1 Tax=Anopheles atroparvus TaxID=41427 RepID=A0A182IRE7_ANOAO